MQSFRFLLIPFFIVISFFQLHSTAFSQSYTDGKIARDDFTLHYKTFGNKGEYIILLAGGPGTSVDYMQPIADSLSKYYRCIMLEQRGTGRSTLPKYDTTTIRMDLYVDDLEALRKHIKSDRVILIGTSWGALLSLLYGSSYPGRVSKIIHLGSGPLSSDYADIFDDNLRFRYLPYEKEVRDFWRDKRKDSLLFLKASFERDKAGISAYYYNRQLGLKEATKAKITDVNYYVSPAFFKAHPNFDIRPLMQKISANVLIIQGRQDPGGEANVIEMQQLIKQATLRFIERCGHSPEVEKPNETWHLVYKFLGVK